MPPSSPPHPAIPATPRHSPLVIPVKTGIHAIAPVIPATPCHSRENGNPRDCPRHSPPHAVTPPVIPRHTPSLPPCHSRENGNPRDCPPPFPPHPAIPATPRHSPLVIPVKTGIHALAPVIPRRPRHPRHTSSLPPCHSRENGNPRDCPPSFPPHPAISAKAGTTGGRARSPAGGAGVCWGDWPEGLGPAANTGKTVHDYGYFPLDTATFILVWYGVAKTGVRMESLTACTEGARASGPSAGKCTGFGAHSPPRVFVAQRRVIQP